MALYATIIGFLWAAFVIIWFVSALRTKRTARRAWWRFLWMRLLVAVAAVAYVEFNVSHGHRAALFSGIDFNVPLNILGVLLTAAGIALAVWARFYLGRNWGMPMSLREGHELVTTGPYALLRHPIYTGILLATVGSGLINFWWLLFSVVSAIYFISSTAVEDKDMAVQFPAAYPAYKARTWRLIPYIW